MSSNLRLRIILLAVLVLLAMHTATANSRPPRNNDISSMADALKYLQDLDTYYGERSRARFGKRTPLLLMLRQRLLETPDQAHINDNPSADEPF
ncbi:PREDICTED: neuropeptide F [Rhagoletis zephyria]|uniref:neuropeptide F n=1 Tax=Rhagoletis zephyria TaxID=28612 RepID=UPI000811A985|nr:PREDICTED: neuropeptide F [Rhagoletis zephyria]XP_017471983.1 PREDICTED: neuropeptide F [Rhagoletis zephyria]